MHYLGSQRGAMYSSEHNLERFYAEAVARNRCSTPIENLYISGRKHLPQGDATGTGISLEALKLREPSSSVKI